jgi:hypothetical protein
MTTVNMDPAKIRVFLNSFYDFEAPEKRKSQPGAEAASAATCAIIFT